MPSSGESATVPFDMARLEPWLAGHVDGFDGPVRVQQLTGGQSNPTFRLGTPGGDYVLRRKPAGTVLKSAHAVDREYRVMTALHAAGFPVPRTYALCDSDDVIGSMFFVMEHVEGRVFLDPTLPDQPAADRAAIYDAMNATVAALHRVDYAAIGLGDYGRPGNYFARQIDRWSRQYRLSETAAIPAMDRLIEWLPAHIPAGDETTIVHGDIRIDNMIFHPTEPRILAVIDWELSTLGHPLGDFAYHLMPWHLEPSVFRGMRGVDRRGTGIPEEGAYVTDYCRRTGRDGIPDLDYYLAYNMFRLAAILQGIAKRAEEGTAASADAVEVGGRARQVAESALRHMDRVA